MQYGAIAGERETIGDLLLVGALCATGSRTAGATPVARGASESWKFALSNASGFVAIRSLAAEIRVWEGVAEGRGQKWSLWENGWAYGVATSCAGCPIMQLLVSQIREGTDRGIEGGAIFWVLILGAGPYNNDGGSAG